MKLSSIRVESKDGFSRVVASVDSPYYNESELFFEVPDKYKDWLTYDVYDAFVIAILYPCMKHKDDIEVDGDLSPRLSRNLKNYALRCISDFSKELYVINISSKGEKIPEKRYHHVGAGFSGGVDSFSSIYDRYEKEASGGGYKIDALLCFNAGSHGDYDNPVTESKFWSRYDYLKSFPAEIGLPFIPVNTNVHAFMDEGHQQSGITRHISCPMALQAAFDRYYYASSLSYYEEKYWGRDQFDFDLSEFCEPHLLPWLSTEAIELVSEGGQYFRSEKTQNIVNYKYAQKYLNVCVNPQMENAKNCSYCPKCMRTLIALDSIDGALDKFSSVFDIDVWKKHRFEYKCELRLQYGKEPFATDNVNFAVSKGNKIPCYAVAFIVVYALKVKGYVRRILGKVKRLVVK